MRAKQKNLSPTLSDEADDVCIEYVNSNFRNKAFEPKFYGPCL